MRLPITLRPLRLLTICMLCCSAFAVVSCDRDKLYSVVDMRCEYDETPLSIDGDSVRFSWAYENRDALSPFTQRNVELRVAADEASLADAAKCVVTSGRVSKQPSQITLSTANLNSHSQYYWQVRVYNNLGRCFMLSPVASFRTAKLRGEKWQGRWILWPK